MQVKIALSKSAREKMRQKKKEEKEHQEVRDFERKEPNPWELLKLNESDKIIAESNNPCFIHGLLVPFPLWILADFFSSKL